MALLTYGSIYFSATAVTTVEANTPVKAAGTTTTMQLADFLHPSDNRLTYNGATTRVFEVRFDGSITKTVGGDSPTIFYLYKDGGAILGAKVGRYIASSGDEGAFAVSAQVSLAQNSYIELWFENTTGDDMTITAGVLSAKVIG